MQEGSARPKLLRFVAFHFHSHFSLFALTVRYPPIAKPTLLWNVGKQARGARGRGKDHGYINSNYDRAWAFVGVSHALFALPNGDGCSRRDNGVAM